MPVGIQGPPFEIIATEVFYFLIIAILCIIIYFKTKEVYDLTKHKGVYYFKNIFLFFALSYFFRLISIFILFSREFFGITLPIYFIIIGLVLVTYSGTMAILSICMAVLSKFIKHTHFNLRNWLLHFIALGTAIIVFMTISYNIMVLIQALLFAFCVALVTFKEKGVLSKNKLTYFLLFIFWVANVVALSQGILPRELKIPIYFISISIFFWIYIRVHMRLVNGKKKR